MDQEKGRQRLGMLFVAGAAILFASKGLFAKALYQRGVGFELLVAVRALLAVPLFAWFAVRANPEAQPMRTRAVLAAVIAGITCYYIGALVDFWALTLIDASIERVLLFSFPALVVLIGSVMKRSAPEAGVVAALIVTYIGIFFAMGGIDLRNCGRTCSVPRSCSSPRSPLLSTSSSANATRTSSAARASPPLA